MRQVQETIAIWLMIFVVAQATAPQTTVGQGRDWARQMQRINRNMPAPFEIDESRVKAAGLRRIESDHLMIYTDVLPHPSVDELPKYFDQCVPQWCDQFGIDNSRAKQWKMRAYLISDRSQIGKFRQAGLIPDTLDDFPAGIQNLHDFWFYFQPGNYYTRHLMIHEGTHAFMQWFLNGYGAPWYSEGMAELMGSHRLKNGQVKIRHRIQDRSEADYWGRVKRIRDERETRLSMTLDDVLAIEPNAFRRVRYYGWSWAACEFFSRHELSRSEFRGLFQEIKLNQPAFNQAFKSSVAKHWQTLERDWQLYLSEIEYGYEVERGRVTQAKEISKSDLKQNQLLFQIRSDRSWQQTELVVEVGDRFRVSANGQFRVGSTETESGNFPWRCEPNGITISYHNGMPLGLLVAGVLQENGSSARDNISGLNDPVAIGLRKEFSAKKPGRLCFRINESPAHLEDNVGTLEVVIEKLK